MSKASRATIENERHPRQPVVDSDEEDDCGVDHQPVGERVCDLAELGFHVPAAREPAVHLVGDAGDGEDDRRGPAVAAVGRDEEHDEERDQRQPQDRQRIRDLSERSGDRGC